jgi:LacI family transcriptional regulator
MVTIHDVAKLAGVSIATVSNVLNNNSVKVAEKTAEKVHRAARELHYIPNYVAKGLKTNHIRNIGVLAEDVIAFSSPEIIDGICEVCEKLNYHIILCNLRVMHKIKMDREFEYEALESNSTFLSGVKDTMDSLSTARVSGLIYIGVHPRDVSRLLPPINVPTIYTYAYTNSDDYCINYNDLQGAKLATEFLIRNNHKKIGLISGSINSVPAHKRLIGYQTALMEAGFQFRPDYIGTGNWRYHDGYNLCSQLLNLPDPPTAIFSMSDLMAYGAIKAALDKGMRIPDDISIHGFDNLEASRLFFTPSLTTVSIPLHQMGTQSAETLIHLIEKTGEPEKTVLLDCSHVERESVKRL